MAKNNLLKEIAPHLEKEWHPTKNNRSFNEITAGNPTNYWWQCELGHEWETRPVARVKEASGCPYCANKRILEGFNDLATLNPELASEWHPTLNSKLPSEIGVGGIYVATWLGKECGHAWEARVAARHKQGSKCPYCAGQKVLAGYNDLASQHPSVASQWHPTLNGTLTPEELHQTSNKKVWWQCEKGHNFNTQVSLRTRKKTQCPECFGRPQKEASLEIEPKLKLSRARKYPTLGKSLKDLYPELAQDWHSTLNNGLTPDTVLPFSDKKVWWACEKGHDYEMLVSHRTRGRSCSYCSGKQFKEGYNDLKTLHPKIAKEWDEEANGVPANKIKAGTSSPFSWVCQKGHKWKTNIHNRIKGDKCPICSNKIVLQGVNDFPTTHPEKVEFWHPTKNGQLKPEMFVAGSGTKVWWKCEKGHNFETQLASFVYMGRACNKCSQKISKQEQVIADYVKTLGFTVKQSDRTVLGTHELDIYIPEKNLAIEYNGVYWHSEDQGKDKEYHYTKWKACKDKNVQLFQIWEDDWDANPELIKNMIAHRLNSSTQKAVFARKTNFVNLTMDEAKTFLNLHHLQGARNATVYNGLEDKTTGELVAVLTATKQGDTLEIIRFATSQQVTGGFSKMLKNTLAQFSTIKTVKSYSDNNHSLGNVYKKNGFTLTHEGKPNYFYIVNNKRVHRLNFTKDRFKANPNLLWKPNYTEKQLAKLNNLVRVWDAGSSLWTLELTQPNATEGN